MKNETQRRTPARPKGSVFQNGSPTLWIKFSDRGIPRRENTHSCDRQIAEKLLQRRLAEVTTEHTFPVRTLEWMN